MKITAAKRIRGQQYELSLGDGEYTAEVDAATFDHSGLRVGSDIDGAALEALLKTSAYNRVRSRALYYLTDRDYAAGELVTKLCRMTDRETATAVVERLCAVGLVNDRAYAVRQAQNMAQYRFYPRRRILQELRVKGVARDIAEEAVEELEVTDFELALALLRKKYYNKLSDDAARARTAAALARYGFGYDTVRRAVEAATEDES